MFNNPFDSFHKTVGQAKKEREQLDRLLTISPPGEIALVVATAGVLLLFMAWLIFGSVGRSVAFDGVLAVPAEHPAGNSPPLEAMVWVERGIAQQIEAGLPVVVEMPVPGAANTRGYKVKVAGVVAEHLPLGSAPFQSTPPVPMQRVRIKLNASSGFIPPDGVECRIVIELGQQTPIALFARGRS